MPCRVMVCTTIIRTAILAFLVVVFRSLLHQPKVAAVVVVVVVVVVVQHEMDAANELPILGRLMKTT